MKPAIKRFFISYSIFVAVVYAISLIVTQKLPVAFQYADFPYLLIYFALFTGVMIWILLKKAVDSPQQFIRSFLLITTVKLLLNCMIAVIFAFTHRTEAKGFLIFFLAYYLVFTMAEVIAVVQGGTQKK